MLRSRAATHADLDSMVETLSTAFYADPTWSWAFPDAERRLQQHAVYWRFLVEEAMRFDQPACRVTESCEAVAIWLPPGEPEVLPEHEDRVEPLLREMLGERTDAVLELIARFGAAHPEEPPHYYLTLLGVHDDHRGHGIGMALLEECLARYDAEAVPSYLESSNPANDFRYERLGYRRRGEFTSPDDAVTVGTYWREAAP